MAACASSANPTDYFKSGKMFVSCEGNEKALAYAIERVGPEPFMFASDFPHEISLDNCMEEINEIVERHDLKDAAQRSDTWRKRAALLQNLNRHL